MNKHRKVIRQMGFIRDQEGIMNRYLHESGHWEHHLERTRAFITGSFSGISGETAAVLGSGWLLDVPLKALSERFKRIILVDIFHPPQIIKKVEMMQHVSLLEADLTGGAIEQVWNLSRNRKGLTDELLTGSVRLSPPIEEIDPDVIISVNLLNQLDIIPCDYLIDNGFVQGDRLTGFRHMIQSFHLDWITRIPGCLVTDTREIYTNREDNTTSMSLLYTHLPEGSRSEGWTWEFDTRGTYRKGGRTYMEVKAVEWA